MYYSVDITPTTPASLSFRYDRIMTSPAIRFDLLHESRITELEPWILSRQNRAIDVMIIEIKNNNFCEFIRDSKKLKNKNWSADLIFIELSIAILLWNFYNYR